jgi:hypothetical protein
MDNSRSAYFRGQLSLVALHNFWPQKNPRPGDDIWFTETEKEGPLINIRPEEFQRRLGTF